MNVCVDETLPDCMKLRMSPFCPVQSNRPFGALSFTTIGVLIPGSVTLVMTGGATFKPGPVGTAKNTNTPGGLSTAFPGPPLTLAMKNPFGLVNRFGSVPAPPSDVAPTCRFGGSV
jgi:hypothetical protein